MAAVPMQLPRCQTHPENAMELRPAAHQTPEQRFCGAWYDCTRCGTSTLFTSPALREHLASQGRRAK